MAGLILPNKYRRQPQYSLSLDREGLGKGVQLLFNPALGMRDQINQRIWAPSNDTQVSSSVHGKAFLYDGVDDDLNYTGYPEIVGNVGTFAIYCPIVGPKDVFGQVLFGDSSIFFYIQDSLIPWSWGVSATTALPSWFDTTNRSLVFTTDGTSSGTKFYLDGIDAGITYTGTPLSFSSSAKSLALGRYTGSGNYDFNGLILSALYSSVRWSPADAFLYHQSKGNAVYKATPRKIYVSVSASFNSYTITPSGGVTFAGTNNLIKGKVIVPSGGIVFSGTNPITGTRSYPITPSGGITFGGTGSMVSSNAQTYIITPTGGVTFSGSATLIKTNIVIPLGGIVFSGSAPMTSNTVISTVTTRLPMTGAGS